MGSEMCIRDRSKADDVIVNDGEIGDLISKIDKIHQRYIELADG